jgi:hypothetical protein
MVDLVLRSEEELSLSSSVRPGRDEPNCNVEITVVLMLSGSQDVVAFRGHPRNDFTTPSYAMTR